MSTAEKPPKQKRHWPYSFEYEYENDDRGIIYRFTINTNIQSCYEPDIGIDEYADFEFKVASLDHIIIKGENPYEPDVGRFVNDPDVCAAYCEWFQAYRIDEHIHDELQSLCIAEYEKQHEPDYGI